MKTKDFVKMLQEADPTGECYVRVPEGAILFAEPKEGYWDGPYSYRDGENFVISTRGSKVDIHTQDAEDFIWGNDGDYSKIKLDFAGYSGETLDEKVKGYQEKFKKTSEEYKRFQQQSLEHHTFQVLKKLQGGWKIKEEKPNNKYMMDYVKGLKKKRMCVGECQAVHKTDLFESYKENEKYRFWRLKNGKN